MKYLDKVLITILSFLFALSMTWNVNGNTNLINFLVCFIVFLIISNLIYPKICKYELKKKEAKSINKKKFWIFGLLIAFSLIVAFLAYYPGYATPDSLNQWKQVQTGIYSDWHPLIQTLFFMKLPSLFYNNIVSCTIFQMIFIFSILMYFCYFFRKNFLTFKQTLIVLSFIIFNPLFFRLSVTLWKDIGYSWALFLGTILLIEIVISNGNWIKKNRNKILLILTSLGILLFRHNGIICFILMFLGLAIFYKDSRKFYLITMITILIMRSILTGPVYQYFEIDKNGGRAEMLGEIMGQIAYYYNHGVEFSEEEYELLNELAPLKLWEENYRPTSFNDIKFNSSTYLEVADERFSDIIKMYLNKSISHPKMAVVSYLNMTSPIWKYQRNIIETDYGERLETHYEGDVTKENTLLKEESDFVYPYLTAYNNLIVETPLRILFLDIGQALFVILTALAITISRWKKDFKKYLPFILVLSNTAVIMLLITGEESRFVYAQALCAIPLCIYAFISYKEKKERKKKDMAKTDTFFHRLFIEKTDNSLIQFIRYFFVGGVAAVVNIGMLYIFTDICHIYYLISNVLSFTMGLIVNYILSKKFVFQEETKLNKTKEFLIYAIIGILGLGIDTLLMGIFTSVLSIYYMISKIISTMLVFIWNFGARKVLYKIIK